MEKQYITNITEKPNSYEFGKAGNRFKIYYDKPVDLKNHLLDLQKLGFEIEMLENGVNKEGPTKEDSVGVNSPAELGQI